MRLLLIAKGVSGAMFLMMEETEVIGTLGDKVPGAIKFRRLKRNQEENQKMIDFLNKRVDEVNPDE